MALATLSIDLVAQIANLQTGLDKATRLAEKDAARMERAFAQVRSVAATIGGGLVAGLSVTAVTQFITSTNDALLAIKDLAEGTGSSVEQISALENALRANNRTLDEAQPILVKFNGALKEADGKNGISQALAAIGLNVQDLRRLDPVTALQAVGRALQGYADDGNKARLVQELFGKSVAEVIPFLNDLAEAELRATDGIRAATEQADKFEKNLARLRTNAQDAGRAITGDVVAAINELFDVLRGRGPGELNQWLAVPLQAITVLAANVGFVIKGIGTELGGIAAQAAAVARLDFSGAASIGEQMREDAKRAREEFDKLEKRLLQIGAVPSASYSNEGRGKGLKLPSLPSTVGQAGDAGRAAKRDFTSAITDPINEQLQAFLRSEKAVYAVLEREADAAREAVQRLISDTDTARLAQLKGDLQALLDYRSANGDTPALAEAITQVTLAIDELNSRKFAPQVDIKSDFLRSEKAKYEETEEQIRAMRTEAKGLDSVVQDLGLTFSSAFEDAIVNGKKLRDVLQGIGQDILRILAREFVTKPLGDAIIKIIRPEKEGNTSGLAGLLGSIFGGLPSYAVGTDYVPRDMVAMIHKGERIVPAAENKPGAGGVVRVEVVNPPGRPQEASATMQQTSDGAVLRLVLREIAADIGTGGPVARAMQGTYGLSRATGAPRRA